MNLGAETGPDAVASAVLEEFRKLPAKRKPAVRDNGLREWVPLAGIVVQGPRFMQCVALATGMKCLPASKLSQAKGIALHDWHAEVLAIRAFNRWILDECRRLALDSTAQSEFLQRRTETGIPGPSADKQSWHGQPFVWREGLTLHMYCSEAPCGDASMELIMSAQEDATPWPTTTTTTAPLSTTSNPSPPPSGANANANTNTNPPLSLLLGRGYFSRLGIVRRKPSRGDAPPTASKSCSDKLALKQCTSLLSSLTSLFVSPARVYLSTLVLPESQFSAVACRRCFSAAGRDDDDDDPAGGGAGDGDGDGGGLLEKGDGCGRMRPVAGKVWDASTGYQFVPFLVETTSMEFEFSRRAVVGRAGGMDGRMVKLAASNLAVAWTRDGEVEEGLVGGVLQGRKAFDLKGASLTSRRRMWEAGVEVARTLGDDVIRQHLAQGTYNEVKEGPLLAARRKVKEDVRAEALSGWLRNTGDEEFSL